MADWMDYLEDFSGALSGIPKGIDLGLAPFKTWEGIRTSDLANDLSEIRNRNAALEQQANEDLFGYYNNAASARDVANRQKYAAGEYDIFGNQQRLRLGQALTDPEGAFMQEAAGMDPTSPQFRRLLAQYMASIDPLGAVAASDKFGIPGLENRNLQDQAAMQYLQGLLQTKFPGAQVFRDADGTVTAVGPDGERIPISGNAMLRFADMMNQKTPGDAVSKGIKEQIEIEKAKAQMFKDMMTAQGKLTPTALFGFYKEQGVGARNAVNTARLTVQQAETAANALDKNLDATPEMKAEAQKRVEQARENFAAAQQYANEINAEISRIVRTQVGPALGVRGGGGPQQLAGPGMPSGGTTLTTQRHPVQDMLDIIAGGPAPRPVMNRPAPSEGGSWSRLSPEQLLEMWSAGGF